MSRSSVNACGCRSATLIDKQAADFGCRARRRGNAGSALGRQETHECWQVDVRESRRPRAASRHGGPRATHSPHGVHCARRRTGRVRPLDGMVDARADGRGGPHLLAGRATAAPLQEPGRPAFRRMGDSRGDHRHERRAERPAEGRHRLPARDSADVPERAVLRAEYQGRGDACRSGDGGRAAQLRPGRRAARAADPRGAV